MKYLYGQNVFLTGGSSGIGLRTAELFAETGYKVFAASRNPAAGVRTFSGGGEIHPVKMDVRDPQSVNSATDDLLSQTDIGIVIHGAGIGIACPGEYFPSDSVSGLFETNYNGVLRINSRIIPHMRQRGGGLCIIISSLASIFPVPFQSHYCSTKAALDQYAATLRMELREFGVRVCLILPGDTNTGFTGARKYEIDESSPYYKACLGAVQRMERDELGGRPPQSAAKAILRVSGKKNPPLRTIVGFNYKLFAFLKRPLPDRLVETVIRKMYLEG